MSEFIEWVPKHHGHQPLHWTPDMLTSVDGKNFVRQSSWAWIAGSTYYVPYEAVHGVRREVVEGVDPLVEALIKGGIVNLGAAEMAADIREALAKRDLKIVEVER